MTATRVLVCGGRDYADFERLCAVLDALRILYGFSVLIEGGARGADSMTGAWAIDRGIPTRRFPANWATHGKRAGSVRNAQMLDEGKPDFVVAFPGGAGTRDMVTKARRVGVAVFQVT